ncbi:MAG TPA: MmgE/PrpD family protein, partial [Beijerinckiaceae bacterium]|nr:MmgE/PrpD family protein [Beijerinckiaceae bacterium]
MDASTVDRAKVTQVLADFAVRSAPGDVPAPVYKEAVRSFLNWTGCAVGGSIHPTIDNALAAIRPFAGPGQASVLGRGDKLDLLHAALVNGISSHVFDFDDTHLKTIIHPAGPIASALLPLAETRQMSGRDFLHAFILGVEVECRIGNAV